MGTGKKKGKRTILFQKCPYISAASSVAGEKEGNGPLGKYFDEIEKDPMFGGATWEEAESRLQNQAAQRVLKNAEKTAGEIDYLVGGDLLGQLIATSFGIEDMGIPFFGVYGACSTMGESLSIASMLIDSGYAENVMALTSSHNSSVERQFRFPPAYGNQKPLSATWTVTGGAGIILSGNKASFKQLKTMTGVVYDEKKELSQIRVTGITTGKIMDYGIKDSMNMGAVMAPAACDVIKNNLKDLGEKPEYYDRIITGDLGKVGKEILLELLEENGFDIEKQYMDCGMEIYDEEFQDTHSGGSGCGCCAVTLSAYLLKMLLIGEWKRILFVPTGALLSPISFHEGNTVPAIAHGVIIERE